MANNYRRRKFNDNTAWYLELQGRIKDDIENFDQGFFRPALNFKITDQSKFWIGYAYIDTKATDLHSYEDRWVATVFNMTHLTKI